MIHHSEVFCSGLNGCLKDPFLWVYSMISTVLYLNKGPLSLSGTSKNYSGARHKMYEWFAHGSPFLPRCFTIRRRLPVAFRRLHPAWCFISHFGRSFALGNSPTRPALLWLGFALLRCSGSCFSKCCLLLFLLR